MPSGRASTGVQGMPNRIATVPSPSARFRSMGTLACRVTGRHGFPTQLTLEDSTVVRPTESSRGTNGSFAGALSQLHQRRVPRSASSAL